MKFEIDIRTGYKEYRLLVEQINCTKVSEQFKISNLSGTLSVTIQSNRPFFRNKGLKKRKPNYELVEGKVTYPKYLKEAFIKIMQELEPDNYPKPRPIIASSGQIPIPSRRKSKEESSGHWGESRKKA